MTSSFPPIGDVMANPEWLAHRYDASRDAFHMLAVPRRRHAEIAFLTDEYLGETVRPMPVKRVEAMGQAREQAPLHFIFHSAFCCSTLMAAAFDIPGLSMGLKEPMILNDIVGWRHRGATGANVARVLDEAMQLLARPFTDTHGTIVKPSNIVNPLIPAMLALRPASRALFMYAPLSEYLVSIARKGMTGRLWVRDLMQKLAREGMIDLGIQPEEYLMLTDLQVAAVGWLAQQQQFHRLTEKLGERVVTLDSATFMSRPNKCLLNLASHFELDLKPDQADAIVNGSLFRRDSKTGGDFAGGQRAKAAIEGRALHADELDKVEQWARVLAVNNGIPLQLSNTV